MPGPTPATPPRFALTPRGAGAIFFAVVALANAAMAFAGPAPAFRRVLVIGLCAAAAIAAFLDRGARGWAGAAAAYLSFRTIYVMIDQSSIGAGPVVLLTYLVAWMAMKPRANEPDRDRLFAWQVHAATLFQVLLYSRAAWVFLHAP